MEKSTASQDPSPLSTTGIAPVLGLQAQDNIVGLCSSGELCQQFLILLDQNLKPLDVCVDILGIFTMHRRVGRSVAGIKMSHCVTLQIQRVLDSGQNCGSLRQQHCKES